MLDSIRSTVEHQMATSEPQLHVESIAEALSRLYWDPRDLFISSFAYGHVGNEADLHRYLATGTGLTPAQVDVLVATLNDGLRALGDHYRV